MQDAIQAIEIGSRVEIHLSKTDEWSPGVVKKCPQWSSTVLTTPGQKNCFILMNKCDNKEYNKEHNREKKWKIKEDCDKENNKVSLVEAWRIRLPPGAPHYPLTFQLRMYQLNCVFRICCKRLCDCG